MSSAFNGRGFRGACCWPHIWLYPIEIPTWMAAFLLFLVCTSPVLLGELTVLFSCVVFNFLCFINLFLFDFLPPKTEVLTFSWFLASGWAPKWERSDRWCIRCSFVLVTEMEADKNLKVQPLNSWESSLCQLGFWEKQNQIPSNWVSLKWF